MIILKKKGEYISCLRLAICSLLLFVGQIGAYAQDDFKVVLDAGHGGKDPGRPAKSYSEKDIALSIVLNLGEQLKKKVVSQVGG